MSESEPATPIAAREEDGEAAPPVRILVVCTANICRSPVVEVLLRAKLGERGLRWQVASGGTLASSGHAASRNSVLLMEARGLLELSDHRSHEVQEVDVAAADLVLCMERRHVDALQAENRAHRERIHILTAMIDQDEDVADPYGGPLPWYETMVSEVEDILDRGLDRIIELASQNHAARRASAIE